MSKAGVVLPNRSHGVSQVSLRPAIEADFDGVARIWLEGWNATGIALAVPPDYRGLRARLPREIANGWQVTVAERQGAIAGFVALTAAPPTMEQLFVAPEHHRSGVGRTLLDHARNALPGGFTLWTHADNLGAKRFYAAAGLVCDGAATHPRHGQPIVLYRFAGAA